MIKFYQWKKRKYQLHVIRFFNLKIEWIIFRNKYLFRIELSNWN